MSTRVKKMERPLKSGKIALYMDYVADGKRVRENTSLALLPGKCISSKDANKTALLRLQQLITKKQAELDDGIATLTVHKRKRTNFVDCYKEYIALYPSKERRYTSVLKKLVAFHGSDTIPVATITECWLERFLAYLCSHLTGETPYDYFKALERVLKFAVKAKLFPANPAIGIKLCRENNAPKNVLTITELQALQQAQCPNEAVKRAFLFSSLAGLRYCDIKCLTWGNISSDNTLTFIQSKTGFPVILPLQPDAILLLGERGHNPQFVFSLPTNNGCNKSIAAWVKNAGIDKHITYHSARHTCGTNYHIAGVDVLNIASILGHASITHTQKYVRRDTAAVANAMAQMPKTL